jgi:hypothetical protein
VSLCRKVEARGKTTKNYAKREGLLPKEFLMLPASSLHSSLLATVVFVQAGRALCVACVPMSRRPSRGLHYGE